MKKKNNKEISLKYNNYDDQHIDKHKHGKCNKEKLGCLHVESIIKNVQKNQKILNIRNHEGGNELKMSLENVITILYLPYKCTAVVYAIYRCMISTKNDYLSGIPMLFMRKNVFFTYLNIFIGACSFTVVVKIIIVLYKCIFYVSLKHKNFQTLVG